MKCKEIDINDEFKKILGYIEKEVKDYINKK